MVKNLVIVESPAKSQTIKKYLWDWFEVKASFGHVVDLPKKNMWIDIKNNFQPTYQVSPDKKKVIAELKQLAKWADKVWIATDEDREWEAIWRHVANQLWLNIDKTPRIVFHEITKTAITEAIKNPRTLDMNLVDAQQARRVLDRLVGFELSPVLRRKVKWWLSAWRVQSVAVRVVVEREREIQKFNSKSAFKTIATFIWDEKKPFEAELDKKFKKEDDVLRFMEEAKISDFEISEIETKPGKKTPSAPFTTSTLQQEASRKMWYPVAKTMQLAQKLYESGAITYMRTDSVNLSETAIQSAQAEIIAKYWKNYAKPTRYSSKSKWAQEAHECIRPTDMSKNLVGTDSQQKKLYELIRKRTIASQMAPAVLEKTKAVIDVSASKSKFVATGEVIKFDGFLKVYMEWKDDDWDENAGGMLPILKVWENLNMDNITSKEVFEKHPPRYTEASLVKKLEDLWIGRPSTYAPTISTIQKRWYVTKENREWEKRDYRVFVLKNNLISDKTLQQNTGVEKNKLFPTDIGMIVNDFLIENFSNIMDYSFTADVEEQFDKIASGNIRWQDMIQTFYWPFHSSVDSTVENANFAKSEKNLGIDPKTGLNVIARMWRYWPLVQIGPKSEDEKPQFAPMPEGKNLETITLEDALRAFDLPRELWELEWKKITVAIWRFGPYVKYDQMFVSLKKDEWDDPYTLTKDRAIELIKDKLEFEKNKYILEFKHKDKKIEILNGRYGAYIKFDNKNYKIPKKLKDEKDPQKITKDECLEIIGIK